MKLDINFKIHVKKKIEKNSAYLVAKNENESKCTSQIINAHVVVFRLSFTYIKLFFFVKQLNLKFNRLKLLFTDITSVVLVFCFVVG